MPKRRDFPPRALRGSAEPQQFPWAEGYPVFLPIPSAGKTIRVLRGRIILELTNSAPETSGLRRQGFAPYKTLLMPAFSLPRPPGELALPPSPANGTFHYPTPFPPTLRLRPGSAAAKTSVSSGEGTGFLPPGVENGEATTSVLRSAPLHLGGPWPHSTELLRFLLKEPPPRPLRRLLGASEGTEPIPGELGISGRVNPPPSAPAAAVAFLSGGNPLWPGAVKHLSRGRAPQNSPPSGVYGAALGDGSFQAYPVECSASIPFSRGRRFRDLNRWSGLFPSRPRTFAPRV